MKPTPLLQLVSLAWASLALAQSAGQPPAAGWRESQHRDPADTYNFVRFDLVGKFLTPLPETLADRPDLRVDCIPAAPSHRSKFLGADLLVGARLKILYIEPEEIRGTNYFPKVSVRYRTDGAREEEQKWPAGTDRIPTAKPSDKTSASIPRDALKRMLGAHTVAITVDDEHGTPVQLEFDMPDPAAVEAACKLE
jgi:hypothetical protein